MSWAIELQSLSKTYLKKNNIALKSVTKNVTFKAVDNVTLKIPRGQIFGFLGPNGAGKTTTIKMICGLIKPTNGTIKVNGYDLSSHRMEVIKNIGAVLEGTRNIYWQLSAWQNIIYFGKLKGCWGKKLYERAEILLKNLELWERKDDLVSKLSRGMQQKVAIACALISDPEIILLDEPTLGLDTQASRTLKIWIKKLAHEENKTIILTTHQLDIAEQLCDRIAIIHQGSIITDRPTQELLQISQKEHYQIIVSGKIEKPEDLFENMNIIRKENETIFLGSITNQEDLYERLNKLRSKNLSLVSITPIRYNLEEIFIQLVKPEENTNQAS